KYLGTRRLVMGGFSGDVCVLFTAGDAYMRDLHVHVPPDCVVSISPQHNEDALAYMERTLDADLTVSTDLDLKSLAQPE
ncbi:MAG TPA: isochorismatase family protein, partial [Longimicrobium sp.]|nr:isochorismatase family protein [Longimicrobium sp.]